MYNQKLLFLVFYLQYLYFIKFGIRIRTQTRIDIFILSGIVIDLKGFRIRIQTRMNTWYIQNFPEKNHNLTIRKSFLRLIYMIPGPNYNTNQDLRNIQVKNDGPHVKGFSFHLIQKCHENSLLSV